MNPGRGISFLSLHDRFEEGSPLCHPCRDIPHGHTHTKQLAGSLGGPSGSSVAWKYILLCLAPSFPLPWSWASPNPKASALTLGLGSVLWGLSAGVAPKLKVTAYSFAHLRNNY